jgi:S1-C subfamily serine protease
MVILSGRRRGHMVHLGEKTIHIVRGANAYVGFIPPDGEPERDVHATMHRAGDSYEVEVASGCRIWVNGQLVDESRMLESGDLLEIGHAGPVIRFRTYPPGVTPKKTLAEAFADSRDGARVDGQSQLGRTARFLSNITKDLVTQTSLWFRLWVLVLLTALVVSVVILVTQNIRLQKRVAVEGTRIEGIAELLERTGAEAMTREDLLTLQSGMEARLAATLERIKSLEARSDLVARLISSVSPSVAFVQGSFGFIDPTTQRPLRYVEGEDGIIVFTLEENGQELRLMFSGTAFVVSKDGLLLTNKHVAEPWQDDPQVETITARGLTPVISRLLAYFPGVKAPLELRVVKVSTQADLALIRVVGPMPNVQVLRLEAEQPRPGDEVLVLGYPLGTKGLVVRASAEFLEAITPDGDVDLWAIARHLSDADYIKPLATRGIVSQVSEDVVTYDAETTVGGSGGPVVNMDGSVVAITAAIITQFGGSNLGVPASIALTLLQNTQPAQ